MAGLLLPLALVILALFCIAGGIWGADSRPGLGDELIHHKARWFPHSKTD